MIKTILAVESSCDETALSVVQEDCAEGESVPTRVRVLAHVVRSQTEAHLPFGGVVPEVAARDHLAHIDRLARETLAEAQITPQQLDGIAVTMGPGLIGALMVGVLYARGLALALQKPLIAVNHVDAHLAPALLLREFSPRTHKGQWIECSEILFPALALTVSGGHCLLSYLESPTSRTILGKTADDACGEAFDKVAKLLGLPYPGGPYLEQLALKCSAPTYRFPVTLSDRGNRYGFSFSGLKTAVLNSVREHMGYPKGKISGETLEESIKADLARSFQEAAIGQLLDRMKNAFADKGNIKSILVAGGVAANTYFRERMVEFTVPVHFAPLSLCSDNATMIALHALLVQEDGFCIQPFSRYFEGIHL